MTSALCRVWRTDQEVLAANQCVVLSGAEDVVSVHGIRGVCRTA